MSGMAMMTAGGLGAMVLSGHTVIRDYFNRTVTVEMGDMIRDAALDIEVTELLEDRRSLLGLIPDPDRWGHANSNLGLGGGV